MSNYYANIGSSNGTRDPVDRYETPDSLTEALLRRIDLPRRVREPSCGTGRMAAVLRAHGHEVHATDLVEDGVDFLETDDRLDSVVTNPPYRDRLAEAFARHALELTDGPVALLLRTGFLGSQGRYERLHSLHRPSALIFVSSRVHFYKADGGRISGQAHDHVWVVWNAPGVEHAIDFVGPDELPDVGKG